MSYKTAIERKVDIKEEIQHVAEERKIGTEEREVAAKETYEKEFSRFKTKKETSLIFLESVR